MSKRPTPWEQLDGVKFTLEQILEQTVEWERSRIIKLLESDLCGGGEPCLSDGEHCDHDEQTLHLIALIKGENK